MRKWLRRAGKACTVLVALIALAVVVLAVVVRVGGLRLEPVLSGSMRPTFQPGDLAVIRPVAVTSLRKGDIIEFLPPGATTPRLHRIASITRKPDKTGNIVTAISTRGDANNTTDPWGTIHLEGATAYKLDMTIPSLGWLSQVPKNIVIPIFIILAGILMLFAVFTRFSRTPRIGRRRKAGIDVTHKEGQVDHA